MRACLSVRSFTPRLFFRLSTVKDADVIAVFGRGNIIDAGRHEELLRTSKTYSNLVRKQLSSAHSMLQGDGDGSEQDSSGALDNADLLGTVENDDIGTLLTP